MALFIYTLALAWKYQWIPKFKMWLFLLLLGWPNFCATNRHRSRMWSEMHRLSNKANKKGQKHKKATCRSKIAKNVITTSILCGSLRVSLLLFWLFWLFRIFAKQISSSGPEANGLSCLLVHPTLRKFYWNWHQNLCDRNNCRSSVFPYMMLMSLECFQYNKKYLISC